MELRYYLRILRRNWIAILGLTILGGVVGGVYTLVTPPTYIAKTQLFVAIQNSGSVSELQQGNTFTQARVQSYVETVGTPAVLQPVIDSLDLNISAPQLETQVTATSDLNTVLITISAEDSSPVQAAAIAQAVAESLVVTIGDLERPGEYGVSPVNLSVVTPATAPTMPAAPNAELNLAFGLIVGLVAGIVLAALRTAFDTRIRGEAELRSVTSAPLLGGISFDPDAPQTPLLTQVNRQDPRQEAFKQIRTNLQFANVSRNSKVLLVTSSIPGEGKSTTATNMAIALAQAGQRVALVDADLRRPMISTYMGLEASAGLTTALVGSARLEDLLQPWGDNELYVLTAGQIPPNPSELLGSEMMFRIVDDLATSFDTVIIDAPPLIPVTDAAVLAQQVGSVVLVVGAGKVRTQDLERSIASLQLVGADVMGTILNLLPAKGPDAYTYSYYSYETKPAVGRRIPRSGSPSMNGSHMNVARRARRSKSSAN